MTGFKKISIFYLIILVFLSLSLFFYSGLPKVSQAFSPISPPITPTPPPITPPSFNRPPVITTKSLPFAFTFKRYSTFIEGYDLDLGDKLNMTVLDLPFGLSQKTCRSYLSGGRKYLRCEISGTPLRSGKYAVRIYLSDQNTTAQVKLTLQVLLKRP